MVRRRRKEWRGREANEQAQKKKIERKYPADASQIKHPEEVRGVTVIEQNSGYQEAREHKKEIDSAPREAKSEAAIRNYGLWIGMDLADKVMPNDNEQNRNPSHTV